jgi:hypothetical protein
MDSRVSAIKALKVLAENEILQPGKGISWPIYDGPDITDAIFCYSVVNGFFCTGTRMPIPGMDLVIDIISVEAIDDKDNHKVTIEGIIERSNHQ